MINLPRITTRFLTPLEKNFLATYRRKMMSELPKTPKLLEIGAGTGANFQFYPACEFVAASEISCSMLQLARPKVLTENLYLVQNSAENLPFAANEFDAALATLVFCSVKSPVACFAELQRVVKKRRTNRFARTRPSAARAFGYIFDFLNMLTVPLFEDHFQSANRKNGGRGRLKGRKNRSKGFRNHQFNCLSGGKMKSLTQKIKDQALAVGFHKVGVARAEDLPLEREYLEDWLKKDFHGEMCWMEKEPEKRTNPQVLFPAAKSVISCALNYYTPHRHEENHEKGKISRYAWGDDYHDVLKEKLRELLAWIKAEIPRRRRQNLR